MQPISLFVSVILTLLVLSSSSFGEGKHLKVAALLGLSGDAAYHSDAIRKGLELAADDLRGTGWKVDLRFEDDQTDAAKIVTLPMSKLPEWLMWYSPRWAILLDQQASQT